MSHTAADHQLEIDSTDVFGFWMYILTDCVLFASLFATYIVLHPTGDIFGPSLKEQINLHYVLVETFALLASNFTFGLAILSMNSGNSSKAWQWLVATFAFGAIFVGMELYEFYEFAHHGYVWHASGGASAFFTLVGTHGLHVSIGLLWIAVMIIQLRQFGSMAVVKKRLVYLGIFWNFLDIVWIFLFSIVYLMGAL